MHISRRNDKLERFELFVRTNSRRELQIDCKYSDVLTDIHER